MNFFGFLTPFFRSFTINSPIPYIFGALAVLFGIAQLRRLCRV